VAVGQNSDGRLEAFAVDASGAVWHDVQVSPGGGWSSWASLGGSGYRQVAVAQDGNGRLEAFAVDASGAAWHDVQTTPGGQGASGASIWSTPAYDPASNIIYAGTGNNFSQPTTGTSDALIAFNATNGHILWVNQRTPNDSWTFAYPTGPDFDFADSPHLYQLANGRKVVSSGQKSGFFHVLDAATGNAINQIQVTGGGENLGGLFATAAVDQGVVFADANQHADGNPDNQPTSGELVAIAGDGSHTLWSFPTPAADLSGVAVANGVVYFQSQDGNLYALNEATGGLLAQIYTGGSASGPAISNGRIYLGQGYFSSSNGIVALGI
jgi:polyvinyl alcohol dehydrogenase (cytochrome)